MDLSGQSGEMVVKRRAREGKKLGYANFRIDPRVRPFRPAAPRPG